MTPSVFRYNLDPTGVDPDNLVLGEIHQMEHRAVRAIAPKHGAFFAESLRITDTVTGVALVPGVQFYAAELYAMPSGRYGKEIDAVILIVDPNVADRITISYQALGGEFSTSAEAIMNMINNLNIDGRPVAWGAIVGKPDEFVPARHLHDLGDIYGFEYVVHALNRIESAILIGDVASHDSIYQYIDTANAATAANIELLRAAFNAHNTNMNNPHNVTAAQLGVYTYAETDQLLVPIKNAIQLHVSDKGNPHSTTAAQVGAYTKEEVAGMVNTLNNTIAAHANRTDNPHNVTPTQLNVYVKEETAYLDSLIWQAHNAHAANMNNPHGVTAQQLNVFVKEDTIYLDNLIWAAHNSHLADKSNPHNVTPAQLNVYTKEESAAVTNAISQALNSHATNGNNPHATTAAQVGAFTKAETTVMVDAVATGLAIHTANMSNPHNVTPAQLNVYIKEETNYLDNLIWAGINAHTSNMNNPHNTTAAQVGAFTKAEVNVMVDALNGGLAAHTSNMSNPHNVTAAQLNVFVKEDTLYLDNQIWAALNGHTSNGNNPHNTTAAQVGAFTKAEVQVMVDSLNNGLAAHTANLNNPHGTTAAQLNVYTREETNYLDSLVSQAVAAHTGNLNNPHGTTAAQVGAFTRAETTALTDALANAINGHAADKNNPHATTAAQVGAYTIAQIDGAFANVNNIQAATANRLAQLIANPDPFPQYLTAAEGNAAYVSNGTGIGQTGNVTRIGYDGNGKTKITIDATDFGNIAMEGWVTAQVNAVKTGVVNFVGAIPGAYVSESIYVRGIGTMEWTSTSNFTGYRCIEVGSHIHGSSRNPRGYELDMSGGLVPKGPYLGLWAWAIENSFVVSEADWYQYPHHFLFADYDASHFRLPDLRNMFIRGTGWNYETGTARNIGEYVGMSMQAHNHTASTDSSGDHVHGTAWGESGVNDARHGIYSTVRGIGSRATDGDNFEFATSTNGAHAHSVSVGSAGTLETRPESVSFTPRIHI